MVCGMWRMDMNMSLSLFESELRANIVYILVCSTSCVVLSACVHVRRVV